MKTVLITRSEKQAKKFQSYLDGVNTLVIPAIKVSPINLEIGAIEEIQEYIIQGSWSIFTSANAANAVNAITPGLFKNSKIAAVGEETARELKKNNLSASFIPKNKTATGLVQELCEDYYDDLKSSPVLVFQGTSATNEVCESLELSGVKTKKYIVYDVSNVTGDDLDLGDILRLIDLLCEKELVITFFSGKTAKSFENLIPSFFGFSKNSKDLVTILKESPVVVVGEKTREVVEELGYKNILEPEEKRCESMAKMLRAMLLPC